ncbi:uncharacterized protein LOC126570371 [Anopheles aquasalis]|uniref:uncharacterized protein LOC126570371 n=1 Tax=Anopheles aquasalis TaxID=42839 RepID=UPI00215AD0D1|nr:uncharacterized protein LOC126570371 [Anopheles aquasalis]XP_050084051.1 uncharacterized protein LOC126570371 [Anopheles aquasalis]
MQHSEHEEPEEDGNRNMVSNMPLLFADGYPTSLDRISEAQLEKFIPFMVQCSLGHIEISSTPTEYQQPPWWPKEVEFTRPFKRPKSFRGNWLQKMREIVVLCYSHNACVYLLRYCNDLASYQHTSLRFINNYNSTTSLYERSTNKLLVTFRNENMLYDREQITSRKCLLPKQSSSLSLSEEAALEEMVISASFDIYLCDNCDAELYSYGAMVEHEKVCLSEEQQHQNGEDSDDDDVIFCGEFIEENLPIGSAARERAELQKKQVFLGQNFALCTAASNSEGATANGGGGAGAAAASAPLEELKPIDPVVRGKNTSRPPRRTRGVLTLAKTALIPLSSPAGEYLLKTTKATTSDGYVMERLERMERFCHAPPLPPGTTGPLIRRCASTSATGERDAPLVLDRRLPKWLLQLRAKPNGGPTVPVTYKRSPDDPGEPYRLYKFPRRQLSDRCRRENYLFYNKPLLQRCRPCVVQLERLTREQVETLSMLPLEERLQREAEQALAERNRWKELAERATIIDSIDLCSSDDDDTLDRESAGLDEGFETDAMNYETGNMLHPTTHLEVQIEQRWDERIEQFNENSNDVCDEERNEDDAVGVAVADYVDDDDDDDDDVQMIVQREEDMHPLLAPPIVNCGHYYKPIGRRSNMHVNNVSSLNLNPASSFVPSTLLSDSTIRLNQALYTDYSNGETFDDELQTITAGIPSYKYANGTSATAMSMSGSVTKATANGELKENRLINGRWLHNSSLPVQLRPNQQQQQQHQQHSTGFSSQGSGANQGHSLSRVLLTAPPIAFTGAVPRVSLHTNGIVHQSVSTTTTIVNQSVRKRMSVPRASATVATANAGATLAGANLQ